MTEKKSPQPLQCIVVSGVVADRILGGGEVRLTVPRSIKSGPITIRRSDDNDDLICAMVRMAWFEKGIKKAHIEGHGHCALMMKSFAYSREAKALEATRKDPGRGG